METVKENEVYKRERETRFTLKETITLKLPVEKVYIKEEYDWYMTVALEKVDKVTTDRRLLTADLILQYRWAIREGYQHQLDSALKNRYDYPRNQNTVKGIQGYIDRIKKASDAEMENL
ncbi:hypothetical protein [Flavobacterium commune]|uniref:Uncharacterized protein n=1 Tax=Flavobacterium commune TaxID=1306519 RepID=A0A1D9PAL3_9FLAO|nr:hypothetical protein [Flavobacterium commune]AOZ99609.1 hypothetical protein BIW12_09235 [Flavobacterium commune]